MNQQNAQQQICVLPRDKYFRPNEHIQIQFSDEYPDYIGILHQHKFIEIVYILSGTAMHTIAGKTMPVKRGDLFIVNMDTPHVFLPDNDPQEPFRAYDLIFTPEFFDQSMTGDLALETLSNSFMFYSLFGHPVHHPYFSVSGSSYTMFEDLFKRIYDEHRGQKKGYIEIIRAYLLQLIVTIFRMEDGDANKSPSDRSTQTVNYVLDYLQKNYSRHISIQELADRVFFNRDYLARIFRKQTGTTITNMLQKIRLEQVCHLLSTTEQTVAQIADTCGFDDRKHFYTVFKKHLGVLPGEYRKSVRIKSESTTFQQESPSAVPSTEVYNDFNGDC